MRKMGVNRGGSNRNRMTVFRVFRWYVAQFDAVLFGLQSPELKRELADRQNAVKVGQCLSTDLESSGKNERLGCFSE